MEGGGGGGETNAVCDKVLQLFVLHVTYFCVNA